MGIHFHTRRRDESFGDLSLYWKCGCCIHRRYKSVLWSDSVGWQMSSNSQESFNNQRPNTSSACIYAANGPTHNLSATALQQQQEQDHQEEAKTCCWGKDCTRRSSSMGGQHFISGIERLVPVVWWYVAPQWLGPHRSALPY